MPNMREPCEGVKLRAASPLARRMASVGRGLLWGRLSGRARAGVSYRRVTEAETAVEAHHADAPTSFPRV